MKRILSTLFIVAVLVSSSLSANAAARKSVEERQAWQTEEAAKLQQAENRLTARKARLSNYEAKTEAMKNAPAKAESAPAAPKK